VRGLPVRVKLLVKVRGSGRKAVVKGLVNTGFTSEFPDIMIPVFLAERLGLWPRPDREVVIFKLGKPRL
jgi:predicted aspartyl protease